MVGFALTYAMMLTGMLNGLARNAADFELRMNSIERLNYYINVEPEEDEMVLVEQTAPSWPTKGTIRIRDVEARYKENQDHVLKEINCEIRGAEKIGIVGRTGAGKVNN